MGSLGPKVAAAVPELMAWISSGYRDQAMAALARIGPAARQAIPVLVHATGDRDVSTRRAARETLCAIRGER